MLSILAVDDDQGVCDFLSAALTEAGYAATCVQTFAAAAERLDRDRFDFLMADVRLPDGRGSDLVEKAEAGGAKTLLFAGYIEEIALLPQQGAPHLAKPFRLQELTRALERLRP